MAGLLDFLGMQQGQGGGLLGLGSNPVFDAFGGNQGMMLAGLGLAGGATPGEGFKNMMPALQSAFEQQNAQRAGMALLGAMPGGNQPPQQPSSFGAVGPGASYSNAVRPSAVPATMMPGATMPGASPIPPPQFMPAGPVAPPMTAPRPSVMPTSKVWGDNEAVQAGLYDPPNGGPAPAPGVSPSPQPPIAAPTQRPPPGSPMTNQPGAGLQLVDSPALQGMPDTVRRAIPLMLQSKTMAPQAMTLIQKYINPDQWQMWRDNMGNVFTRNSATGESKPLLTPTPDMMNANASGMKSPFEYQAATQLSGSAAKNTELTPEQKNAAASGPGMTPATLKAQEVQDSELAKNWAKKYETAVDAGSSAQTMRPQLQMVKQAMTDPNFYSGIGEGYNLTLKKIGAAIGLSPDAPVSQEVVGKVLAGQVTAGLKTTFGGAGLGPVRVVEFNQLKESLASKTNSPPALAALVTMAERTHARSEAIAEIAQTYNGGSGRLDAGFDRAVAQYDREHPILSKDEIDNFRKIASAPSAAAAKTANPYEAEARRRGLIQ